jgi:hypothetical protein
LTVQGAGDPLLVLNYTGTSTNYHPALWFQQDGNPGAGFVWWDQTKGCLNLGTLDTNPILSAEGNGRVQVGGVVIDGKAGDILLLGEDCAEEFDVAEGSAAEPGMVMVLDAEGALRPGKQVYDRRVAGVISGAGDLRPALRLGSQLERAGHMPLALTGKVFCRVDADLGPVEVGDLPTTSSTQGHAMKASDSAKAFGAVLGKALAPLKSGRGLIPILVALQ